MTQNGKPRTLFEKVWDAHIVREQSDDTPAVLYIDLHLVHEVTSPQAFSMLRERGLKVRRPDQTIGTMDHSTPTTPRNELGHHPDRRCHGGENSSIPSPETAAITASRCTPLATNTRGLFT